MRAAVAFSLVVGLAACGPQVPDSAEGVGFTDYNSYIRGQEAARMAAPPPPFTGTAAAAPGAFSPDVAAAAIDRAEGVVPPPAPGATALPPTATATATATGTATGAVIGAAAPLPADGVRPRGNAPAGIQEESGEMVHSNAGISDEQDFAAVAARETIESDAERIARNRAEYTVVAPTAVPERPSDTGPNIVEFALSTSHPPGTQMYDRSSIRLGGDGCARYASPDLAQQAFLEAGGPDRDRRGLDPDGDGYACAWDPRPFRAVKQ
jgi:hypothetical protein